jgi:hypothetical protein
MKGSILEQLYNGSRIEPGAKVRWGSKISLVIAGGLNEVQMMVPDLLGLTYTQAKAQLDQNGIIIGAVIPDSDVKDTAAAFVYKQTPARYSEDKRPQYIRSGQLMDLYLSPVLITPRDSAVQIKQTDSL